MAVKAPKVQTVAQASKDLNPAYAESKKIVNEQISGLGAKYDAQRSGIQAERGQGFNAINNQATGRGGSFSGVPIDEQATYLSTKYLPGMQLADYQQNAEGLQIKGTLADINKEQRLGAVARVDQQKSALNAWNLQQLQIKAAAKEAEKQRKFQAQQSALERSFTASQNAISRSAAASQAASAQATINNATNSALKILTAKGAQGGDKKVSPSTFQNALNAYVKSGGSPDAFRSQFAGYANLDWSRSAYGF